MTGAAVAAFVICAACAIASYGRARRALKSATLLHATVESFDSAPGATTKGMTAGNSSLRRYRLRLSHGDTIEVLGYAVAANGDGIDVVRDPAGHYALRSDLDRSVIWWMIGAAVSAAIAIAAYFNLP